MSFADDLKRFEQKVVADSRAIFVNVAATAHESIVNGSPITGAPGQPVDTGNLRNSWQLRFPDQNTAEISTNVEYAPYVEDNVRNVRFKNHGPHSVKLTIAGLQNIVAHETAKVTGGAR